MELSAFLAFYAPGIASESLSPEVREGLNAILRTASREALKQVGEVLQKEAAKRGIKVGSVSTLQQQTEAAQKTLEDAQRQAEAEAAKQARQKRNLLIGITVAVAVLIGTVVVIILKKRT